VSSWLNIHIYIRKGTHNKSKFSTKRRPRGETKEHRGTIKM